MHTRVITVARQIGTSGEDVAMSLAQELKFRYIDYQVIQQASHDAGVSPETVSDAEHTPSLLTRVLESLARNPSVPSVTWADPAPLTTHPLFTSRDYREFVGDVVRETADVGNCVIVGHAAHRFLRDREDTLRVMVTASLPTRVKRVMENMATDEKTAIKTIERTDAERADYFRRFFDVAWLEAPNYDISISTDSLSVDSAVELILMATRLR